MTNLTARMLPMLAVLVIAGLSAGVAARADDAMKPADQMKSDDGMMKADAMKADAMQADAMQADAMQAGDKAMGDCNAKAGMEADQMKKDEAMKACDAMGMKSDAMGSAMKPDATMKPAQSN